MTVSDSVFQGLLDQGWWRGEEALLEGVPCLDGGNGRHGDRERALEALKERMGERGTW